MAYVRRHWFSSVLYTLVAVFVLALILTPTLFPNSIWDRAQAQETEPRPIDPYLYTRVQALRQEIALTNQDLAAMGCSKESATLILENLKTWTTANQAILNQHRRDELDAKAEMRSNMRQIRVGTADHRVKIALSDLQDDLAASTEQRKSNLDGLVAHLESLMDAYQRQTWRSARDNAGLPVQFRHVPDLSDQQRRSIHMRIMDRSSENAIDDAITVELSHSQKQALGVARLNTSIKSSEVFDAESAVLPLPDVLMNPVFDSQ